MAKSMKIKSGRDWNDRNIWVRICENVGYSPEKIGAYVLENILNGTGYPATQEPDRSAAVISTQNNTSGSLPLSMDELREMNDADV